MINHEPWTWELPDSPVIKQFTIGRDDLEGDNITNEQSLLEGRYMYWVWKNIKTDYIGLQFRRRFLYFRPVFENDPRYADLNYQTDLTNNFSIRISGEYFIAYCQYFAGLPEQAFDWIKEYDILTSKAEVYGYPIGVQYCACHVADHWNIMMSVLKHEGFTDEQLSIGYLHPSNIWIMKWELFEEYVSLWWRVFSQLKELITPPEHYYQNRVFGFLTERFFTIWLGRKHQQIPDLKVKLLPILFGDM